MNIVLMTNTYKPIVGGLEKSVETYAAEFQKRGHRVLIVAPEFKGFSCCREPGVFRVPAIRNFDRTDFSIELPVPTRLARVLEKFKPDIIHSQHPFLIGDTALRAAAQLNKPLIFTYHTLYERNRHYFFGSKTLTSFVIKLSIGYANLCDRVVAPSQTIAELLKKRGVYKPIDVIPTGIRVADFKHVRGQELRKSLGIPEKAFLAGTVSRIAEEKNIIFLAHAAALFLKRNPQAYFLMVGEGALKEKAGALFEKNKVAQRAIMPGTLTGKKLFQAYAAMDVFTFASHSETQGLILAEAMAAGKPVVTVSAPAVGEIVQDKKNGRIVPGDSLEGFAQSLSWIMRRSPAERASLSRNARATAGNFSVALSVKKMLNLYRQAAAGKRVIFEWENSAWSKMIRLLKAQTNLLFNTAKSTVSAMAGQQDELKDGAIRPKRQEKSK